MNSRLRTIIVLLLTSLSITLATRDACYGIPAFARKYHASCTMCHLGFPKLNSFGEAFRKYGYRLPEPQVMHAQTMPMTGESTGTMSKGEQSHMRNMPMHPSPSQKAISLDEAASGEQHVIHFSGRRYTPSSLAVKIGDVIMWEGDFSMHPLTLTQAPAGAERFAHIKSGSSYSYTVKVAGTYNYICDSHVDEGMVGSFTATEGASHSDTKGDPPAKEASMGHSDATMHHEMPMKSASHDRMHHADTTDHDTAMPGMQHDKMKHESMQQDGNAMPGMKMANSGTEQSHVIQFEGHQYTPNSLDVRVGDTLVWQGDFSVHPLTLTKAPAGVPTFASVNSGQRYSYVVQTPGSYEYVCDAHKDMGMVGSFTASGNRMPMDKSMKGMAMPMDGHSMPGMAMSGSGETADIHLGGDGEKDEFPNSVWPDAMPSSLPVAVLLEGEMDYNPFVDPRVTFDGLGNQVEMLVAASLDDQLSIWGQLALNRNGIELNRIFLNMKVIDDHSFWLRTRIGVFEPTLFSFSTHRAWLEGYWLTTRPLDATPNHMGWTIEETQKGLEAYGFATDRLLYSAGVVEGFGSLHADKDWYAHVSYQLTGETAEELLAGPVEMHRMHEHKNNSLTVGGFVYRGISDLGPDTSLVLLMDNAQRGTTQSNAFTVIGGDVNWWLDPINLFGGATARTDDQPFLDAPSLSAHTTTWFSELDLQVYPWLLPGVRFESWTSDRAIVDPNNAQAVLTSQFHDMQIVPGVVFLVRPNVKLTLRSAFAKLESMGDTGMHATQTQLFVTVGI